MVNYVKLPYYGTKVAISKTQEKIRKLLKKYNLQGIRFTEYGNIAAIEFILLENNKEMAFRFKITLPEKDNLQRQVYGALFYYLKARFTSVDFGINTVEKEFFQELILKLPDGSNQTVLEIAESKGILEFSSADLLLPLKKNT